MSFFSKTTEQPTVIDDGSGQRLTFTFSIEGLAAREELLFKGYVRLLDHLCEHQWQYHEASATHRVDLLVADERANPTRYWLAADKLQPVLQLGASKASGPLFLSWPLKPDELERELNRLGRLMATNANVSASDDPAVSRPPAAKEASPPEQPVQNYRLRQWPRPILLSEPGRMRLATLLTGKAMSLDEMVFRSALPKTVCERFLADMQAAGLIVHPDAAASQAPAWVPPPSLPGRLAQDERQANQAVTKSVVQPGLLTRIRMRFGIKSARTN